MAKHNCAICGSEAFFVLCILSLLKLNVFNSTIINRIRAIYYGI